MLTPIKTPAPQAGMLRKETWESGRKSPSKAKKPSKLLSQQVYNKTELTAWEIKHSHQVYCCLYITSYLPLVHPNLLPEYCMPSKLSIYIQYKIYNNNNK